MAEATSGGEIGRVMGHFKKRPDAKRRDDGGEERAGGALPERGVYCVEVATGSDERYSGMECG